MKFLKLDIQLFAHHKGQGSTSNGRDSAGRRLGAKAADGEFVTAGSIIYRQRGTKMFPGVNTRRGNDDTIYSSYLNKLGLDDKLNSENNFYSITNQSFFANIYYKMKYQFFRVYYSRFLIVKHLDS